MKLEIIAVIAMDIALLILIILPLSVIFLGFQPYHTLFFISASIGYIYYFAGVIRWKKIRWYENLLDAD